MRLRDGMSSASRILIVGAGPAGASLAYLLARNRIDVTLLERQHDFAREFRGEVLMASGVRALRDMGLGNALSELPARTPDRVEIFLNRRCVLDLAPEAAWFEGALPVAVSQPALLERLVSECARFENFHFVRGASVRDLLHEGGRVAGVRASTPDGERRYRAELVVGGDGRASVVRRRAALPTHSQDVPMDIVWCKFPCPEFISGVRAYAGKAHLLVAYRTWDDSLQVAWVIVKGQFRDLVQRGVESWVSEMAEHVSTDLASHLRAQIDAVGRPFLLDCVADRVTTWSVPGAFVLGDAAHTMSPVGAQGLNLALRDAIVAANHFVPACLAGSPAALDRAAKEVEAERLPEVALIQRRAALPPRILLSHSWWGEPVRRLVATLLQTGFGRSRLASIARLFQFGTTEIAVRV